MEPIKVNYGEKGRYCINGCITGLLIAIQDFFGFRFQV